MPPPDGKYIASWMMLFIEILDTWIFRGKCHDTCITCTPGHFIDPEFYGMPRKNIPITHHRVWIFNDDLLFFMIWRYMKHETSLSRFLLGSSLRGTEAGLRFSLGEHQAESDRLLPTGEVRHLAMLWEWKAMASWKGSVTWHGLMADYWDITYIVLYIYN